MSIFGYSLFFYFIGKCFALPYKIKPSAILHTNLLRKFGALRTQTGTFDEKYYYSGLRMSPFVLGNAKVFYYKKIIALSIVLIEKEKKDGEQYTI